MGLESVYESIEMKKPMRFDWVTNEMIFYSTMGANGIFQIHSNGN